MPISFDTARGLVQGLLPELILTGWALLLTLHAAWRHKQPGAQRQVGWLTLVGVIGAAAATLWLWRSNATSETVGAMAVDTFRWAVTLIVLTGVALSTVLAIGYLDREGINVPEYHVMVLFAAVGMLFMVGGNDLLLIFLGLETMSVSVYVLAGINRKSIVSAEAALKYFLLGAFASAFLLYGIALLYGATGTTRLVLMASQTGHAMEPGMALMYQAGVALLLVGFAFKVAAMPFHMWAPDVYDGAPTPVTALMSTTVKAAAFGALLRVLLHGIPGAQPDWSRVLWWLAAITMVGGNLLALAQRSLKRMLAYSSIAHAGYLLVALVPGSVAGAGAFLYYLMFYTLATIGAFAVLIAKGRNGERDVTTDDLAGLSESHPLLAGVMAVSMLSLLGFPGTAGFIGKWYIIATSTGGNQALLAVVLVLASVLSAGYYLPVIMAMYMKPRLHDRSHDAVGLPAVMRGLLALVVIATIFFGVWPGRALTAARMGTGTFMSQRITTAATPVRIQP